MIITVIVDSQKIITVIVDSQIITVIVNYHR